MNLSVPECGVSAPAGYLSPPEDHDDAVGVVVLDCVYDDPFALSYCSTTNTIAQGEVDVDADGIGDYGPVLACFHWSNAIDDPFVVFP